MNKEEKSYLAKEKILKAAIKYFGKNGYLNVSMNDIAREANLSKGLLYYYFKNKDDLYLSCVEYIYKSLLDHFSSIKDGITLESYLEERMKIFRTYPNLAKLFFEALLEPPFHLVKQIEFLREPFDSFNRGLFLELLKGYKLKEEIDEEELLIYMKMLQELINGFFNNSYSKNEDIVFEHEEKLKKVIRLFLYGIVKEE